MNPIEEVKTIPAPKLYRFPQDIGPTQPGPGVQRAKKKSAEDHDVEFDEVAGRKLGYDANDLYVMVAPVGLDGMKAELSAADHTREAFDHIRKTQEKFGPTEYDAKTDSILTDLQNLLSELSINLEVMDEEVTREDRPSRHTIVEELLNGDRDPVDDADEVGTRDFEDIEVIHKARDGSIIMRYTYHTAYEGTEAGQVIEFDIMEVDTDE